LKLSEQEVAKITRAISEEYEEAVRFAEESPYPPEAEALQGIYV
jgi:TPP-dependent pyruvate/acetoin dehydrogenase alpha subunit